MKDRKTIIGKNLRLFDVESKKVKFKRNGDEKALHFIKKKQIDSFSLDENGNYKIVGYIKKSKLSKYKDDRDTFKVPEIVREELPDGTTKLSVDNDKFTEFDMYSRKNYLQYIYGYIPTNVKGCYIAIEANYIPFLLIPIVAALLVLLFVINPKPNIPIFNPDIDEGITQTAEADPDTLNHEIKVNGFTGWSVPANTTENIKIPLQNPEGNPCYFQFQIILENTGEIIYQSKDVPPGKEIQLITLNRALAAGEYKAKVHIITKNLITGQNMNTPEFEIKIKVS